MSMRQIYASCPLPRSAASIRVCDIRGYCGPFVDQGRFDEAEDAAWHGLAQCAECSGTVSVEIHEARAFYLLLVGLSGREQRHTGVRRGEKPSTA